LDKNRFKKVKKIQWFIFQITPDINPYFSAGKVIESSIEDKIFMILTQSNAYQEFHFHSYILLPL